MNIIRTLKGMGGAIAAIILFIMLVAILAKYFVGVLIVAMLAAVGCIGWRVAIANHVNDSTR